jgi:Fe-S oxidoreductase/nitrate reductase gamma subunit
MQMNVAEASRQIYWNISHVWVMYVLLLPTVAIACYGIYQHISRWRQGVPAACFERPVERIRRIFRHVVLQAGTARDAWAGWFHGFIFYGFIVLTLATTVVALDADLGMHVMHGAFYLYFQSFVVDIFGGLVLAGVVMAGIRRFMVRPKQLVYTNEAAWILSTLFVIVLTGFLLEGWRIAVTHDPWASWSPVGNLAARASGVFMTTDAMRLAHRLTWWFHLVLCFAFIAWVPYTKMVHLITAPLNIYTSSLAPIGGSLKKIDFENSANFGVNSLRAFTWKDLLDLDACTECGRCTANCPANAVGKELSPRDLILQLRQLMRGSAGKGLGVAAEGENAGAVSRSATSGNLAGGQASSGPPLIGAVPALSPECLWQCTTCAACMQACPVLIHQMPKIVDLRRHLVMEEADFPDSMQAAVTSLEKRGHPFSGIQASRLDWTDGLNVRHIKDDAEAEVLFWVGCSSALVERNQKATRATAQLLKAAGVKFAILGRDEKCCGDPARRIGNEFLFESLAKDNIGRFEQYGVRKIVTACPHCFNTLRNEYPLFGGSFEVYHHSEYLALLVDQGRLKLPPARDRKVAFHDPCYLGRHNGIYEAPRQLVEIASRVTIEFERRRCSSFCCGGGGGMSFVEEPPEKRVNQERAREALATGADVVAVACPFCLTMMEDGVNARQADREVRVMELSELLWEGVEPRHTQNTTAS